jgi:hypothetical protein
MESVAGRKRFRLLYGRALMDPSPQVIAEVSRIFEDPVQLFLSLMRRACPELSIAELDWRINCVIGAQVFSQVYSERVGRFFGGEADVDEELAASWILHFLMNGINAEPVARRENSALSSHSAVPAPTPRRNNGARPPRTDE